MRLPTALMLVAIAAAVLAGCAEQRVADQQPVAVPEPPQGEMAGDEATEPVEVDAYINVSSGCQQWTVDVLNELAEQYKDSIDVETIDFGQPEGMKRMKENGINCMTLLFDGSPVVRIPDEQGGARVVTFFFPVGFGWTHDDLRDAFAAVASGEAEFLSEEEARKALEPVPVDMEVTVEQTDEGADVLMDGQVAFTITEEAGGKTPMERAEAAKEALTEWTSQPVHPHQLGIVDAPGGWSIIGKDTELVRVYEEDAEAAGVEPGKKLASEWFSGIRSGVVAAVRAESGGDPTVHSTPPESDSERENGQQPAGD